MKIPNRVFLVISLFLITISTARLHGADKNADKNAGKKGDTGADTTTTKRAQQKNLGLESSPILDCSEFKQDKALQSKMKEWNEIFTYKKTEAFVKKLREYKQKHGLIISYFGPTELKFITSDSLCDGIGFRFAKTLPLKDEDNKKYRFVRFVESFKIKRKWTLPSVELPETFYGADEENAYFRYEAVQFCNDCLSTKYKCESSTREVALKVGKGGLFDVVSLNEVPSFKTLSERGDCPEELPERFNSFCRSQKYSPSADGGKSEGPTEKVFMIPEPCM